MAKKILVVGGTGMLGRPVALRLHQDGFQVTVLSRTPDKHRLAFPEGIELVAGNVENQAGLEAVLDGFWAVHINLAGGPRPEDYDRWEYYGAATVMRAAMARDLRRISLISDTRADPRSTFPMIRAKGLAEESLKDSGIPYTIFRPAWVFESLPHLVLGRTLPLLGPQPHPSRWLAAADYAAIVSKAYQTSAAEDKTLTVLGPEPLTLDQAFAQYAAAVPGLRVKPVSLAWAKLQAALSFSAHQRDFVRQMEYNGSHPEVGSGEETQRLLGPCPTTLAQWLQGRR